jgi:hypothetical protein
MINAKEARRISDPVDLQKKEDYLNSDEFKQAMEEIEKAILDNALKGFSFAYVDNIYKKSDYLAGALNNLGFVDWGGVTDINTCIYWGGNRYELLKEDRGVK